MDNFAAKVTFLIPLKKAKAKKKKSAKESKPVISGSEQNGDHIAEEKEDIKKSAKESKPATSGSEETGAQIVEAKKDTKKSAKKTKPATLGSKDQIAKKKNDTKKSAKKRKPATSGSGETGAHIAEEKKDTASPHKGKKKPDVEEEEIPQLIPIQEPSSAKRRKKKASVQSFHGAQFPCYSGSLSLVYSGLFRGAGVLGGALMLGAVR